MSSTKKTTDKITKVAPELQAEQEAMLVAAVDYLKNLRGVSPENSEEVKQEAIVLLLAYRRRHLNENGKDVLDELSVEDCRRYLSVIAKNAQIELIRKDKSKVFLSLDGKDGANEEDPGIVAQLSVNAFLCNQAKERENAKKTEQLKILKRALAELKQRNLKRWEIVSLKIAGTPDDEIAKRLKLCKEEVKWQYALAKKQLKYFVSSVID